MLVLSFIKKMVQKCYWVGLVLVSFSAQAAVDSLSAPRGLSDSLGNYTAIQVTCTNSRHKPIIVQRDGETQWCGELLSNRCDDSELAMAKAACSASYLSAVDDASKAGNIAKSLKPAATQKQTVAQDTELERVRLEVEKERLRLEREKVALDREELELLKEEIKLEKGSESVRSATNY